MSTRSGYGDQMQHSEQQKQNASSMNEEELASKSFNIQSKRFYLDVKRNRRGRFIKIAEVSSGGRKSRILMSMNVADELSEKLHEFSEYIRTLGDRTINSEQLRSIMITRDDRRYYLDLKENDRGKFLRISMVSINSPRTQIAIPAQGVHQLNEILISLINEFDVEDDQDSIESLPLIELNQLPESKHVRVGNKNFYFDVGSNNRGVFLRIAEVRPNYRTVITIPEKVWLQFRDNIDELMLHLDTERNKTESNRDNSHLNTSSNPPSGIDEKKN